MIVQVRQETSASAVLRMRDVISCHGALTCNLTYSRHLSVHQKMERHDTKGLALTQHEVFYKTVVSKTRTATFIGYEMVE